MRLVSEIIYRILLSMPLVMLSMIVFHMAVNKDYFSNYNSLAFGASTCPFLLVWFRPFTDPVT
jgi:hypothetical protein